MMLPSCLGRIVLVFFVAFAITAAAAAAMALVPLAVTMRFRRLVGSIPPGLIARRRMLFLRRPLHTIIHLQLFHLFFCLHIFNIFKAAGGGNTACRFHCTRMTSVKPLANEDKPELRIMTKGF